MGKKRNTWALKAFCDTSCRQSRECIEIVGKNSMSLYLRSGSKKNKN